MDDVLCDYSTKISEEKAKVPVNPYPQSKPGFFRSLEPIKGALAAVEELKSREDIDLYILTAPLPKTLFHILKRDYGLRINLDMK
ncbi:hypothetical protein [Pseudoalteromonas spongiae]|uniref:hypothetical protein n=1 Tax=Pseudoalteromonas spongiae TaxID=298657 RepID=UPI000C2D2510|nr:hypothetical protein [Pseudoalteromonas spongiae]